MNNKERLAAQQDFAKQLKDMRENQPYMFSEVMLEGASTPTTVLNFYIEKVGDSRVIRQLPTA